jgi:hypothetical protein
MIEVDKQGWTCDTDSGARAKRFEDKWGESFISVSPDGKRFANIGCHPLGLNPLFLDSESVHWVGVDEKREMIPEQRQELLRLTLVLLNQGDQRVEIYQD